MQLRIVTYNIHRAIGVDRRFRLERIVEILQHHRPDLALLQEVDQDAPRSKSLDLAAELAESLEFPYFSVGYNVSLRKGRYGNATLSRFPIEQDQNIDLSLPRRIRRGCHYTQLQIAGKRSHLRTLKMFNLHLGLSVQERSRQVGIMVKAKNLAALGAQEACVIGGDFNDWRLVLHPVFTDILGFRCATQQRYGSKGGLRTYPAFSPRGALDRFYYCGPLKLVSARTSRLRLARIASDHLPVIADFELS